MGTNVFVFLVARKCTYSIIQVSLSIVKKIAMWSMCEIPENPGNDGTWEDA